MKDFVFDEFKSQIEKNGLHIESIDDTGLIYIPIGDLTLKISLDNVRKNYERDKDETHISDLVQVIISYSTDVPDNWAAAKNDIYISLFPNTIDFQEFIYNEITDEFGKVYVHRSPNSLSWITKDDLVKWKITETELAIQANENANKLLEKSSISFTMIENRKLGLIESEHETLKGAMLFATAMKEKVAPDFGFPFYAVIPVRDFCYIFSEQDAEFFFGRLGTVVVDEYKQSGYPITTEILKFTDKGVEIVGKYPVE